MTDRVVEIADAAADLSLSLDRLRVAVDDSVLFECPLREIAVIVVSNPRAYVSTALMSALASHGIALTVCDGKRMPTGWLVGIETHVTQSERFRLQAGASLPLRKRLWQALVRGKIRGQAEVLRAVTGDDGGLAGLEPLVRSGDPDNVEARASRLLWSRLFAAGDPAFRRDRQLPGYNAGLNYGYAILRSLAARAVAGVGLHPTLGVHHHSRYDAYCLADDLMEPFRPLVDWKVATMPQPDGELTREYRQALAGLVNAPVIVGTETRSLGDAMNLAARSLARAYMKGVPKVRLPTRLLSGA
jgi:CRISPR-associated protein Cas1